MKKLCVLLLFPTLLFAQTKTDNDAEIRQYVSQVNADSLKSHITKLVSFGTRHTLSSTTDKKRGIGAARNWVLKKFRDYSKNSGGRMEVFLQNQDIQPDGKRVDKAINLGNSVAILKGTNPEDKRVFIIGGHLDSRVSDVMNSTAIAPGANDDGSGVAAVIEGARVLSKSKFPATIIFVAFSGEEQSLLGSKMMAEKYKAENWQIEGVLNNDMIGNTKAGETGEINDKVLRVFSEGLPQFELDNRAQAVRNLGLENDGDSRQLARYIKETGENYVKNIEVKLIYRNDRFLRGGDHTSFVNAGFPAVRLTEYFENYDHQHQDLRTENGKMFGDLIEFMDFEYLRKNTAINVATLANLAKAPSKPENVKMDVKNLTNTTTLSWEQPKFGKVQGYHILVRETDSSVWQKKIFTKDVQMKLPFSKDNYFFAVQSVNETGNVSLPVIPAVSR
ncbi:M28 family metallopeptidase [uncultured Chryseobacterium sp.]|uniref:M28 family metallopeptidase n=1 Tax=uncultured Chryseobacterium sp. TaxID=259322 RepID=UPI0026207643|nr:M28 family metallopeptidase [uncultured Chryseobacterium sp.]